MRLYASIMCLYFVIKKNKRKLNRPNQKQAYCSSTVQLSFELYIIQWEMRSLYKPVNMQIHLVHRWNKRWNHCKSNRIYLIVPADTAHELGQEWMHSERAYSLNQYQQTASEVMEGGMQRSSQNLSLHGQQHPYLPKSTAKYDNQPKHKKS